MSVKVEDSTFIKDVKHAISSKLGGCYTAPVTMEVLTLEFRP